MSKTNKSWADDLTAYVMVEVGESIIEWQNKNRDKIGKWPTKIDDLEKLADEMIGFFESMKSNAKRFKEEDNG